jgi:threonine dehydratase
MCGTALAIKSLRKSVTMIGVQSENAPSMAKAFWLKKPVAVTTSPTLADGMVIKRASEVALRIIAQYVDDIVLVSDSELEHAVLSLLREGHILAEPSGAASIAALMSGRVQGVTGKKVVAVVSGGNISMNYLSTLLRPEYG